MRSNRSSEHQAAVSRRLAQLSAELAAVGEGPLVASWPEEGPDEGPEEGPDEGPEDGEGAGAEGVPENPWAAPATHTRVRPDRLAAQAWRDPAPPTRVRPLPGAGPGLGAGPEPRFGPGSRPGPGRGKVAPPVPVPGRHARRRVPAPGLVPPLDALRSRVALGAGQVAVVAVLAVLALVVTAWWLFRSRPHEVAAPPQSGIEAPSPLLSALVPATAVLPSQPPAPSGSSAQQSTAQVVVDVAGKVRSPGIAVLATGSRVVDALEAAGGARPGVDLTALNLARPLVDGEQILVGVQPAGGVAASALSGPGSPGPAPSGALVALNTADQALLETLPDVGPVTAQAILAWRDEHGAFTSVDELLEVEGIGEATLARLAALVTL